MYHQTPSENSRRRRRRLLCLYVCYSFTTLIVADAFQPNYNPSSRSSSSFLRNTFAKRFTTERAQFTALYGADDNNSGSSNHRDTTVWSSQAASSSRRKSSPLQVRKRVRAVLERAKSRTGIANTSSVKPSNIVAEAATLGGLGDGSDDYMISMKNGRSSSSSSSTTTAATRNGRVGRNSTTTIAFPDEALDWQKKETANGEQLNGATSAATTAKKEAPALDVIKADIPAAAFCEPHPFDLPKLSKPQIQKLQAGERIQEQSRMGREGSGYVVLDIKAPTYVVWECLLDFESYPETIPTVRDMQLFTNKKLDTGYVNEKPVLPGTGRETRHYGTPSVTRAAFILSKFRLSIAAIHQYTPHPDGDYMVFTLDPSCTNVVLKGAKGIWYTEESPEGREGYTRVYLLCEVAISRALPTFIVDYAAERAMPRATTWLRPLVEAAADLWLKPREQQ